MPHHPYKALYIHVPFCVKRCGYCDFATRAIDRDDPRIDAYVEQLVADVRRYSKQGELVDIESVYIGGGTPSHIGLSRLSSLLYALSVSMDLTREGLEFTMEANPESLNDRMVHDIWALGVNRLSLGVQSFDDGVLAILGRAHDAQRARDAVREAQDRFENVSIDLMCGIPGQSLESLEASVREAVQLGVKHVSMYPLTIEPHTAFDKAVLRGESATTMTQNDERRMRVTNNQVVDDLDRRQMEAEDLMLGMRMARGISDDRLAQACDFIPEAAATMQSLAEDGYVEHKNAAWRPTTQGWLCGNDLYSRLLDLAP